MPVICCGCSPVAQKTRAYWTITLFGYVIQMAAVPLLALAGSWWMAALLIVIERAGKAMRNPPRDVAGMTGEQLVASDLHHKAV